MKLSNIEIDIDSIVVASLKETRDGLIDDLNTIKETGKPIGFFSWDDVELEKDEIIKYINALDSIIYYYSGEN